MALRIVLAFFVSFAVTGAVGLLLIPALKRIKAGQSIREDGPVWHNKKQGTPTMGGIMFITGIAVTCLTVGLREIREGVLSHIFVLAFALVYGAIGFIDDYNKLRKKQNLGLKAVHKFVLQLIAAVGFVLLMRFTGNLTPSLYIPFFNVTVHIPGLIYYMFAAFVAVGTVNSVNITDGVDGLATGVSIPVAVYFTLVACLWSFTALGVFAAAFTGGLIAFLFFNFHPAKVFMGDTGSLFLGGAICAMAFAMDMPLILIPLGIVYFMETLSDIIQVTYFKLTHGKRVFKMAPLHHHFEMSGWSEVKLFTVFTAVSVCFAVISYFAVFLRFS
jgi:phospho-N-acetylmuramoyl-pentapeptide-transferase